MSVENAKAFIEKVRTDEDFRKQVIEAGDNRAKMVKEAGFEFTAEDYQQAVDEVGEPVSDEDLEDVAGGGCFIHSSSCDVHLKL